MKESSGCYFSSPLFEFPGLREAQLGMLFVWDCQCVLRTGRKHSRGAGLISASCCYSLVSGYCINRELVVRNAHNMSICGKNMIFIARDCGINTQVAESWLMYSMAQYADLTIKMSYTVSRYARKCDIT